MDAYSALTIQSLAEAARMDRQFTCWTAPLLHLALQRSPFEHQVIADVGAGLGAAIPHVVDHRDHLQFIAIDTAPDRIPVLMKRMDACGIAGRVLIDDAESLGSLPEASVTTLILSFCLTHVTSPSAVMAAVARVLRPGGMAVVADVDYANAVGENCSVLEALLARVQAHLAHALLIRLDDIARATGLSPVTEEQITHSQQFHGRDIARLALNFVHNFKDEQAREWLAAISDRARLRWRRVQRLYRKPTLSTGWMACFGGSNHD